MPETRHALSQKDCVFKPTPFEKSLFDKAAAPPMEGMSSFHFEQKAMY